MISHLLAKNHLKNSHLAQIKMIKKCKVKKLRNKNKKK